MFSSLESPLPKSRQQTIRIILQFSTPLNQVNHCLNGLNNGKKRTSKLSTSTSCSLNKQNVQLLCELRVRYSYASHKLPLRFRYFRYVGYKPENTSATIWTNEWNDHQTKGGIRIKLHNERNLLWTKKCSALHHFILSWSANFATKTLSYDSEIGSQDIITSVKKPLLTIYPSGLPLRQPEKQWPREKPWNSPRLWRDFT